MDRELLRRGEEMERRRFLIEGGLGPLHTFDHIRELVETGLVQVWFGERSVMLTERQSYGEIEAIQCFMAAGDQVEIDEVLRPAIEAWGRAEGCDLALVEASRRGWERVLKPAGYEFWSVTLGKKL